MLLGLHTSDLRGRSIERSRKCGRVNPDFLRDLRCSLTDRVSTKKDTRVGDWAKANNVELAYVPTNARRLNRIEAQFLVMRYFSLDGPDHRHPYATKAVCSAARLSRGPCSALHAIVRYIIHNTENVDIHRVPVTALGIPEGSPLSSTQATRSAVNTFDVVMPMQISDSGGPTAGQHVKDLGPHGFDRSAGRSVITK